MFDSRVEKKRFWRWVWVFTIPIAILAAISFFYYYRWISELDPSHTASPFLLAIIVGVFLIGLPLLGSQIFTRKTLPRSLRRLEDDFYEASDNIIVNAFGDKVFRKLYAQEMEFHSFEAIETCESLLAREETKLDNSVRFSIYVKLSKLYIKEGQADKTVSCLSKAQSIKPDDIILNLKLAEAYEWIGSADDALRAYGAVLTQSLENSEPLAGFINEQIERVKLEGPREEPPLSGLRHMIY